MTFSFSSLSAQREVGARLTLALTWILLPLIALARLSEKGPLLGMIAAAAMVAVFATVIMPRAGAVQTMRVLSGVALMTQVSLLVAAMSGNPWQSDMHMAYFAALAVLVFYCDWTVIVAAATAVALHHLSLSFLLPAAVFPGSANLGRVIVHAAILIVEAGTLIWVTASVNHMFESTSRARNLAEGATQDALRANADAE
jgi:methyl-accepting chemotaxis protein